MHTYHYLFFLLMLHAHSMNAQTSLVCPSNSQHENNLHAPLQISTQVLHPSCSGQLGLLTILAQGGIPPYAYFANGNAVTPSSNLYAGTYTIIVLDASNNMAQTQITLLNPTPLNVQYCLLPPSCLACLTPINVIPSGGTAPYSIFINSQLGISPILLAPGTYSMLVEDANACTFTTTFKVAKPLSTKVAISKIQSLYQTRSDADDWVYPNPFQHKLSIRTNATNSSIEYLYVTNISGRILYSVQPTEPSIPFNETINTYAWPPGVYQIVLCNNEKQIIRKTLFKY